MEEYEKLGVFYLGKEYDLGQGVVRDDLLLYDSKDLVTHGVCVGMTGSGKTGLCISLLEEAAIDGVPALIIDPKGDLPNLLLTFPELRPEDFRPWIDEGEAARKSLTPEEFAAQQAARWREGLAQWGQDGERIRRLREAAEFTVYTPGSTAGMPVSVLKSFAAPSPEVRADAELLQDRVETTTTSLLTLLGVKADPIQSREHILVSTLFAHAWRQGVDLDIGALIQWIQKPPIAQVGVLDVESFFPAKERFELALSLNNLIAAPGFQVWLEGDALDVGRLLHTSDGRPRVSIFSIAHLSEAERMFFVSLLLNEILGWVRTQPGTGSLRALVYMDEIFGYFPPVAEPPSKKPLLTLLKQARAYGVGVLLATQNPVDLDYKGLANTGTWFIGRLQTERDKARVLEGLEGVAAGAASGFDKQAMGQVLAGLGDRVFLMYNVHEDAPVVFHSRWAMSYLRGPLTRTQIKALVGERPPASTSSEAPSTAVQAATPQVAVPPAPLAPPLPGMSLPPEAPPLPGAAASSTRAAAAASASMPAVAGSPAPAAPAAVSPSAAVSPTRPLLPPDVPEYFVPSRGARGDLAYRPAVIGAATVHFVDKTLEDGFERQLLVTAPINDAAVPVDWAESVPLGLPVGDLSQDPEGPAAFLALPSAAGQGASYRSWGKDLASWLYRTQSLDLFRSADLKMVSLPEETEGEFRMRLQHAARERRDEEVEKLRATYAPKLARADEMIRTAQQAVDREEEQAKGAKMQTAISFGATLLSAFTGRKKLSAGTLGKATTAARGVGRSLDQAGDVDRAEETVEARTKKRKELETAFEADVAALEAHLDPSALDLTALSLKPRKSDVEVDLLALAWLPYRRTETGDLTPAWE